MLSLRKVFSVSALSLMLIGTTIPVAASETAAQSVEKKESNKEKFEKQIAKEYKKMTKEERKEKIKKLKYDKNKVTEEQINELSDEMLMSLHPEGIIIGISKTEADLDKPEVQPGTYTMATMPTSDFYLYTVAQRIYEMGSGYDNFQFTTDGSWLINPYYEFTDTIALAWSDSFTLYHDESMHYTEKDGRNYYWEGLRNNVKSEAGVAHDIDLKVGYVDKGSVLLAKVYKLNAAGSANVVGEYGHVQLTGKDVTVGFSAGESPSISFSVGIGATVEEASPSYYPFNY